ncbi:hydantoinase/oxoprolinase N-terminal domain-containing protein [Nocardioides convexus]|uniref:hydantoinase/oxoprolinase N-terminal domain-containing protein n=1 Tax=Nocardioides convexus TaxID=2712224 RepID=UPI0024186A21|nr:hydantoinase/oxoprolinase N-terminal domain-containing protein [Nocardioides convexus]
MTARRIRIGIDTGGTFTDVVAFDEDSGTVVTTKTPSTPANPADGFLAGIDKVLGIAGAEFGDVVAVSHGTTVATNQPARGQGRRPRVHHHRGLRGNARDRPPVRAGRLRQLLLLGEAGPDRPA